MKFKHYLALGDSISIDLYPSLDMDRTRDSKVGAASQLYKLLRKYYNRDIGFTNRTFDGAMIHQISKQADAVSELERYGNELLITVTAGGNDISFSAMRAHDLAAWREHKMLTIARDWDLLIAELLAKFPDATIIVNTLYDPTEDTGTFGGRAVAGMWEGIADEYSHGRRFLSEHITYAVYNADIPHILLADIRGRFEGHGVTAPEEDRWYWREFMIEPNLKGAEQIGELWYETLHLAALVEAVV